MAGVNGGAVAGIVIGCLIGVILVVVVIKLRNNSWIVQRDEKKANLHRNENTNPISINAQGNTNEISTENDNTGEIKLVHKLYLKNELAYHDKTNDAVEFDISFSHVTVAGTAVLENRFLIHGTTFDDNTLQHADSKKRAEMRQLIGRYIVVKGTNIIIAVQRDDDVLFYFNYYLGWQPFQYVGEDYSVFKVDPKELNDKIYNVEELKLVPNSSIYCGNLQIDRYYKLPKKDTEFFVPFHVRESNEHVYLSSVSTNENNNDTSKIIFILEKPGIFS
jgi:hypothetical protein